MGSSSVIRSCSLLSLLQILRDLVDVPVRNVVVGCGEFQQFVLSIALWLQQAGSDFMLDFFCPTSPVLTGSAVSVHLYDRHFFECEQNVKPE